MKNNIFYNLERIKNLKVDIIICFVFVFIVALAVYLQPMICDDYMYCFIFNTSDRIQSFGDAFVSANSYYQNWNGRYFPNLFNHISLCLLPHWSIFIIAAFVVGITLFFIDRLVRKDIALSMIILVYWLFIPDKTECVYMTTCLYNYAVPGACCLGVLYIYNLKDNFTPLQIGMMVLFAFLAAFQHEGISLPLSGAFFFMLLTNRNWKKITRVQWFIIIAFWLGTLFCTFSPGTFVRIGSGSGSVLKNFTFYFNIIMSSLFSLSLTFLWLFLIFVRRKSIDMKEYFCKNEIEILSVILGVLLYVVLSVLAEVPASRYFYFIHLFSVILLCGQLAELQWTKRNGVLFTLGLVAIAVISNDVFKQYEKNNVVSNEIRIIKNSVDGIVPIDELYLTSDSTCHANVHTSNYYGKDKIVAYPSPLYYGVYLDDCKTKEEVVSGWSKYGNQYVIPWSNDRLPDVMWTKIIDYPIICKKEFITHPTVTMFYSKSGKSFLLLTNGNDWSKVINIAIK